MTILWTFKGLAYGIVDLGVVSTISFSGNKVMKFSEKGRQWFFRNNQPMNVGEKAGWVLSTNGEDLWSSSAVDGVLSWYRRAFPTGLVLAGTEVFCT